MLQGDDHGRGIGRGRRPALSAGMRAGADGLARSSRSRDSAPRARRSSGPAAAARRRRNPSPSPACRPTSAPCADERSRSGRRARSPSARRCREWACAAASSVVSPTIRSPRILASITVPAWAGSSESGSAPLPRLSTVSARAPAAASRNSRASASRLHANCFSARRLVDRDPARAVLVHAVGLPAFDIGPDHIGVDPEEQRQDGMILQRHALRPAASLRPRLIEIGILLRRSQQRVESGIAVLRRQLLPPPVCSSSRKVAASLKSATQPRFRHIEIMGCGSGPERPRNRSARWLMSI